MKTIYFDESGFTGYNLLDENQPIFSIASSMINPEKAKEILERSFPQYHGKEFKFSNIWGSRNQRGLLEFSNLIEPHLDDLFVTSDNKRFVVLLKMIDFLIEPTYYESGLDFYKNRFAHKYSNTVYAILLHRTDDTLYRDLTDQYLLFSRNASNETLGIFKRELIRMKSYASQLQTEVIDQFLVGVENFGLFNLFDNFKKTNELQTSTMISIIVYWRSKCKGEFNVICDNSSNFLRNLEMWKGITKNDNQTQIHSLGDGTHIELPLKVVNTTAVDSKDNYGVQLCDILAGLISKYGNSNTSERDKDFLKKVFESGAGKIVANGLRPQSSFIDKEAEATNGPDLADIFGQLIRHHKNGN